MAAAVAAISIVTQRVIIIQDTAEIVSLEGLHQVYTILVDPKITLRLVQEAQDLISITTVPIITTEVLMVKPVFV